MEQVANQSHIGYLFEEDIGDMSFDDLFPVIEYPSDEQFPIEEPLSFHFPQLPTATATATSLYLDNTTVQIKKKQRQNINGGRPRKTNICVFCRFRHTKCSSECITYKIYGNFTNEQLKKYRKVWIRYGAKIFYENQCTMRSVNKINNPKELEQRIEKLVQTTL